MVGLKDNDMPLCFVAHAQWSELEIAEAAAGAGKGRLVRFAVKDRHAPDIVIGHMIVAVFCGSEEVMGQVAEWLELMPWAAIE
jgi:hypothetical protein